MDLPNYFIADLPDQSTLSSKLITEACQTLKENREKFLLTRSTDSIVTTICGLARDWLDPESPFRQMTLDRGPKETGFTRQTLASGLDRFFKQLTPQNLQALIIQDLGSVRRFDQCVAAETELRQDRASIVRGHDLLVHITGGVLPNPVFTSMILGLLARSAQFIKCASGTSFLPRMFAHSLYKMQPKLGACLEIAEWKGGNESLESALFAEAGCLTATGSDETLDAIRRRLPARARFLGYGHKLSFAFIARESLASLKRQEVVASVAEDILAWNQLGCLSPHVIYTESAGALHASDFAEALAMELANREKDEPRGELSTEEAAAISTRRMFYQVRAGSSEETRVWASENSTAWTVIYEEDPGFQASCLNRFVYVKPVSDLEHLLQSIAPVRASVSTAGLSAPLERYQEMAAQFSRAGILRVCPVGRMQNPPLTWRHDGRPALADLVTWTDVEFP